MFNNHALRLYLFTLAAALPTWLFVQQPAVAQDQRMDPQEAGFDLEKLDEFKSELEKEIEAGRIVGCSLFLAKDGQVVLFDNMGERDRSEPADVTNDTIWRIYSMSKPITSAAIMQLVDQDKIDLDADISTYLPKFKDLQVLEDGEEVACEREMTVRDLLRHTSGLTYGFFGNSEVDQAYKKARVLITDRNIEQTVDKLSEIPLLHQPGKRWHYSVSTDVLGRVVEVVSGQSFKDYLQENIFDPLEMEDTFFTVPRDKRDRFAELYSPDGDGGLKKASMLTSFRFLNENELYSGGGGLCSTVDDYFRFCQMLVNKGQFNQQNILSEESIAAMTKDQLPEGAASRSFKFGLGFRITPEGHCLWGGAAGTRFWIDPENNIVGIFMIQINPYQAKEYGNQFKSAVYESLR